jgi:hypothetical protein
VSLFGTIFTRFALFGYQLDRAGGVFPTNFLRALTWFTLSLSAWQSGSVGVG